MPLVPDLLNEAVVSDLILFRFLCTSYDTTDTSDTNDTSVTSVTNLIGNTLARTHNQQDWPARPVYSRGGACPHTREHKADCSRAPISGRPQGSPLLYDETACEARV